MKLKYTLVGNGKLAKHLSYYLTAQNLQINFWKKQSSSDSFFELTQESDYVLLAISDNAISEFIENHPLERSRYIHFSGAHWQQDAIGLHPLMTFADKLYDLETYQQIPFAIDTDSFEFREIFPQLDNPSFYISPKNKALYHALCVTGGNFTNLLWQEVLKAFENELGIKSEWLTPYMSQVFKNTLEHPMSALTGPFTRNDQITIFKNKKALKERSNLYDLYEAFLKLYEKANSSEIPSTQMPESSHATI